SEIEWEIVMDLDPRRAQESRRMVVERAEREDLPLLGGHFPYPGMGRLVRLNERRVWRALELP
ncbi:MAG: MBL fold metallo-hydrolase, partial [Chloroflexi bacterium]|nr:MBL fold metallo-hydrolase [Chloroflexota bacterium]